MHEIYIEWRYANGRPIEHRIGCKGANSSKNAMPLTLPKPVAKYLAAVEAKDTDMLALCFADDARCHDEGRDYRGLEAIKSWAKKTQTKYKYVMEPLNASESGKIVKLHARLTGDFPGSPIELDYTFTIAKGKITALEIG